MVAIVGAVGDAAGELLRRMPCAEARCEDAVRACAALARCDTVEVRLVDQRPRRRGRKPPPSTALLRARYVLWGTYASDLAPSVRRCKEIALQAHNTSIGDWWALSRRAAWRKFYCDEHGASAGMQLPDLGRTLPPRPPVAAHCPPADAKLFVVTYQNSPSAWLCTFLRTLGYLGVPIIVLGWQPTEYVRSNNVFYFTDRVYTTLRYLLACPDLAPDASFMFCDTDELLQVGWAELVARTEEVYAATRARVIVSAEARCMPERLGKQAWAHSDAAISQSGVGSKATAKELHKWPRCLNTGNLVGRVPAVVDLLNRTCVPCRSGLGIDEVYRQYTRAYSAHVERWIYSEQAELMRLYLARPPNESGWALDSGQRLFHPNFWFNDRFDMRVLPDGRLANKHTQSTPAFVHYNGDSKRTWHGGAAPEAVAAALRRAYEERTGDTALARLGPYLRDHVAFLDGSFRRHTDVSFDYVCSRGAI